MAKEPLGDNSRWKIKILKQMDESIAVGICLQNVVTAANFKIDHQGNNNHGFYMMWATSYTYSVHNKNENLKFLGFKFEEQDVL